MSKEQHEQNPLPKKQGVYHHGNLRRAIIELALEHIKSEGMENLSLRAVARRLNVSTAAPYRHFASREAVLAAIAEEGFVELDKQLSVLPPSHSALETLRQAGMVYISFAREYPSHHRVMMSAEFVDKSEFPELEEIAKASADAFYQLIERAQQQGELPAETDTRYLATTAWAGVHGLANLINSGQISIFGVAADDIEMVATFVADHIIAGLKA